MRRKNFLSILLDMLTHESLTVVSNTCGSLWNFSARSPEDQKALWESDAVPRLEGLTKSKHSMIAKCSAAALKNLYTASASFNGSHYSPSAASGTSSMLEARRQRNLMLDLDRAEKVNEIEVERISDNDDEDDRRNSVTPARSESLASVTSNYSDLSRQIQQQHRQFEGGNGQLREEDEYEGARLMGQQHHHQQQQQQRRQYEEDDYDEQPRQNPLQLSRSKKQIFARSSFANEPDIVYSTNSSFGAYAASTPNRNDQQQQQQQQYPMMNNFVPESAASSTSFGGERILSPSHLPPPTSQEEDDDEEDDERPTDYSARFGDSEDQEGLEVSNEADKSSEDKNNAAAADEKVKSYCTEETPLDTPYHFSTNTSITDLREVVPDEGDQQSRSRLNAVADHGLYDPARDERPNGADTPMSEQPQVFCTEDTPGYFSRADSLSMSSLGSVDDQHHLRQQQAAQHEQYALQSIQESGEEKGQLEANASKEAKDRINRQGGEDEGREGQGQEPRTPPPRKAPMPMSAGARSVTFNPHQTPLMYSRASSMDSLASCDQQSIRTGYSSCDFSRMTSGRVSPSDLPDSPGGTMPRKQQQQQQQSQQQQQARKQQQQHDVEAERTSSSSCAATDSKVADGSFPAPFSATTAAEAGTTAVVASTTAIEAAINNCDSASSRLSEEECVKVYEVEGTPTVFSSKSSVHRLTLDELYSQSESPAAELNLDAVDDTSREEINDVEQQQQQQQLQNEEEEEEEEEIYAEAILSGLTKQGMPTKRESATGSRPSSRSDGRRSAIPLPKAQWQQPQQQQQQQPPQIVPRQLNYPEEDEDDNSDDGDFMNQLIQQGMPVSKKVTHFITGMFQFCNVIF